MADQGDNYTQISNDILETLTKIKLNGTQYAICLVVVRNTFGYHRCEAKLSASFIEEATGINIRHIKRELQALFNRNILVQTDHRNGVTSSIGFNKDISSWQPVTKKSPVTNSPLALVTKTSPEPVTNSSPKKERKENIKKSGSDAENDFTPYKKIVDLYHENCPSLSKVMLISANRKTHIRARWEQHGRSMDIFSDLFRKAENNTFLKGDNDRKWKADFDWLMNETNMAKVLEGKYDRMRASPAAPEATNKTALIDNFFGTG